MANIEISTFTRNNDGNTYVVKDANAIPRSGGNVLNGYIYSRNVSNDVLIFTGGTASAMGAYLQLNSENRTNEPGCFNLIAKNSTNLMLLQGTPSGTLTWNGKNVDCVEEQGTEYIRYTNGIQICWGYVSAGATVTKNFPKSFLQIPAISVTSDTQNTDLMTVATCTNQTITAYRKYEYYGGFYTAIGRWK